MGSEPRPKLPRGPIALAVLIITVGVGWLLTAQGFGQGYRTTNP